MLEACLTMKDMLGRIDLAGIPRESLDAARQQEPLKTKTGGPKLPLPFIVNR